MYFRARVVENSPLGGSCFRLRLAGCQALAAARPGQFVMLRGDWGRDPLLPRAFSILRTTSAGGADFLAKEAGRGTRLIGQAPAGTELSVLGPLGRPFPEPAADQVLVAGGVGLAPLLWQAETARARGIALTLVYGARSAAELVFLDDIARSGCRLVLATDDGSRGVHGQVTAALAAHLDETGGRPQLLVCGPGPMMRAVAALARARDLGCLVSVEGQMACGIGACLGCAVPTTPGAARPYRYACVDGPVFDAREIEVP